MAKVVTCHLISMVPNFNTTVSPNINWDMSKQNQMQYNTPPFKMILVNQLKPHHPICIPAVVVVTPLIKKASNS